MKLYENPWKNIRCNFATNQGELLVLRFYEMEFPTSWKGSDVWWNEDLWEGQYTLPHIINGSEANDPRLSRKQFISIGENGFHSILAVGWHQSCSLQKTLSFSNVFWQAPVFFHREILTRSMVRISLPQGSRVPTSRQTESPRSCWWPTHLKKKYPKQAKMEKVPIYSICGS